MDQAQANSLKWWHWCLAIAGLIVLLTFLGRRALTPAGQIYSEKMAAGTTPVIEGESHPAPAVKP